MSSANGFSTISRRFNQGAPMSEPVLSVDWPAYHRLVERLAAQIHESGYRFDSLLCLARGGLRPGDVLSRIFDVPLAILAASSYRAAGGTVQGELDIARYITTTGADLHGRLLLVDDLADTGATIERVRVHLRQRYPAITEIRTAVLWVKEGARVAPEYAVMRLPDRPWIRQPFEVYDDMRPEEVCRRVHGAAE